MASKIAPLLRKGFHEVPELMISLGLFTVGTAVTFGRIAYRKYTGYHLVNTRKYTVIRDTDVTDKSKIGTDYN